MGSKYILEGRFSDTGRVQNPYSSYLREISRIQREINKMGSKSILKLFKGDQGRFQEYKGSLKYRV